MGRLVISIAAIAPVDELLFTVGPTRPNLQHHDQTYGHRHRIVKEQDRGFCFGVLHLLYNRQRVHLAGV